jgi:hypothetical protein
MVIVDSPYSASGLSVVGAVLACAMEAVNNHDVKTDRIHTDNRGNKEHPQHAPGRVVVH